MPYGRLKAATLARKMDKDYLVLKRASASRPSGEWKDDDFDVLADGALVGRIFQAVGRAHRLCAFSTAFPGALARLLNGVLEQLFGRIQQVRPPRPQLL